MSKALLYHFWIQAMQEELNEFERNNVWDQVPKPMGIQAIDSIRGFRNKMDEDGNVVRNKARLVVQRYKQEEGLDFEGSFALWLGQRQ